MESQPQNPEFRINPENFYPCLPINLGCIGCCLGNCSSITCFVGGLN